MADFPSLQASRLYGVLTREPLSYEVVRERGSHKTLKADGRPTLHLAFHDRVEVPPRLVRKILTKDVGLSEEEALGLL